MDKEALVSDIKKKMISALNLQGMSPDSIESDTPLFGDDGLGLDSVDALELVVMVEKSTEFLSKTKLRRPQCLHR